MPKQKRPWEAVAEAVEAETRPLLKQGRHEDVRQPACVRAKTPFAHVSCLANSPPWTTENATVADLSEAVTTLESAAMSYKRVLGQAHPETQKVGWKCTERWKKRGRWRPAA